MEHETWNLTDDQWSLLEPLMPSKKVLGRGRPGYSNRAILDAIFWVRRTASPWTALPPGYPSYLTCRRQLEWVRSGLLPRILDLLFQDLRQRGLLDLSDLLAGRLIALRQDGSTLHLAVHPSLIDTWQLSTLMVFLAPHLKRTFHRRRLSIFYHPMQPAPLKREFVGAGRWPAQAS